MCVLSIGFCLVTEWKLITAEATGLSARPLAAVSALLCLQREQQSPLLTRFLYESGVWLSFAELFNHEAEEELLIVRCADVLHCVNSFHICVDPEVRTRGRRLEQKRGTHPALFLLLHMSYDLIELFFDLFG